MNKKLFVFFIGLILFVALLSGCGNDNGSADVDAENSGGETDENAKVNYTWIAGSSVPSNDPIAQSLDFFAKRVSELSEGQIEVQTHHGGSIGTELEMIESIRSGNIQMAVIGQTMVSGWYPAADFWIYPFLFDNEDHKNRAWDEIKEEYSNEVAEEAGVRPIAGVARGPRLLTSNKVVETPEDMEGLKIRTPENDMWVEAFKRFGASPTALPFPEVYTALQTGVIDGQENPLALTYSSGIFEVNTHLAKLEHMMQDNVIVISEDVYQGLSPGLQEIVSQASEETEVKAREDLAELNAEIEQEIIDRGIKVNEVDKEAFRETVEGMEEEFPYVKKWVDRVREIK